MVLISLSSIDMAYGLNLGDRLPLDAVKLTSVDGSEVSVADAAGPNGTLVFFICNH